MHLKVQPNEKYRHLLIALLILLASMLPISASAQNTNTGTPPNAAQVSHFTAIAIASLYAQLNVLTNSVNASDTQELAFYYQVATQQKVAQANIRRAALVADGIVYGKYNLQFSVTDIQIDEDTAILYATEYTAIELDNAKIDPLAPQTTEYVDEHTFRFQYVDGAWYLTEDQVRMPPNAEIDPELGPVIDPPSATEPNMNLKFSIYLPVVVAISNTQDVQAAREQQILVDLNAVANYARKWWNSANPDYRNWLPDADCTNFVSQALKAGG